VSASGLSPSSSARSRHARAVSQSAAAIARSPPRSRSSRAWTPIAADHLTRATAQPANPTPPGPVTTPDTYATATRANNILGSDRRKCRFALGAVVSHRGRRDARAGRRTSVPVARARAAALAGRSERVLCQARTAACRPTRACVDAASRRSLLKGAAALRVRCPRLLRCSVSSMPAARWPSAGVPADCSVRREAEVSTRATAQSEAVAR
jgi:hypothetical protein